MFKSFLREHLFISAGRDDAGEKIVRKKIRLEKCSISRRGTGTKFALNTIETETETHVNHPVLSPTVSAT
jgi:hypothetical protein